MVRVAEWAANASLLLPRRRHCSPPEPPNACELPAPLRLPPDPPKVNFTKNIHYSTFFYGLEKTTIKAIIPDGTLPPEGDTQT